MHLVVAPVAASPMSPHALDMRDVGRVERPAQRTIVVVICILYAFLLALVQGNYIHYA